MHSQTGAAAGLTARRTGRRPGRLLVGLLGTMAALGPLFLTSGCVIPPSPAPGPGTTTTTAASAAGSGTTSTASTNAPPTVAPLPGPGDGPPPAPGAAVIRWVPIGPAAPSDPPEGTLYELVRDRNCAGLRESTLNTAFPAVWTAAEATCQALATGLPGDWDRARAALSGVTGLPPERCWEIKVTESLRQAVDLRTAHPGAQLQINSAGAGDDCPRRLTGLTVLDGPFAGQPTPTVSSAGGTQVRLEGFFVNVDRILVDGTPIDDGGQQFGPQFGPFVFSAPPAAGASSVRVTVEATPPVSGAAVLVYSDETPPGPGPTPSEPATSGPATTAPPSAPPQTGATTRLTEPPS